MAIQLASSDRRPGPGFDNDSSGSKQFLGSIIDALSAHVAILDHAGVVIAVNEAWKRFAMVNGYRGSTFGVGEAYLKVCDEAAGDGVDDACRVAQGMRDVMSGKSKDFRHHYRCDLPSGPLWYQARITRFEAASVRYIVVTHEDITEVRQSDEAARLSDQRLHAVLTGAPVVLFALDREGVFTMLTGDGLRNAGLHEGELVGRSIFEAYRGHPEVIADARRALRGETFTSVARAHERVWETRYSPYHDADSTLIGTIAASVDATDRHNAQAELARYRDHLESLVLQRTEALARSHEQLAQADRLASLGTLAAGLGHDIANLLLPMRCHLDALEASDGGRSCVADVAALRQALELLRQLCSGLRLCVLDPANVQGTGHVTELRSWWSEVEHVITCGLPKGVELRIVMPDEPVYLAVAPHQISQAVLNLFVNAGEAMVPPGTITLRAAVERDGRWLRLEVIDTGVGMSAHVRRHAFEPFFTTKKRGRSTGLGLSLVHSIVTAAGGAVTIESEPEKGTAVLLTLPLSSKPAPDVGPDVQSAAGESPVVAVTIANERRAALWLQVLRSAGCLAIPAPEGDPDDADVWLTEACADRVAAAKRFLADSHQRRLVVYGPLPIEWAQLGACAIDESRGIEGVREALRLANAPARKVR